MTASPRNIIGVSLGLLPREGQSLILAGALLSITLVTRSAIAEWMEDFSAARPRSSLGYQTPAVYGSSPHLATLLMRARERAG